MILFSGPFSCPFFFLEDRIRKSSHRAGSATLAAAGRMTTTTFSRCSRTVQRYCAQGNLQFSIALICTAAAGTGDPPPRESDVYVELRPLCYCYIDPSLDTVVLFVSSSGEKESYF